MEAEWLKEFMRGIKEEAEAHGVDIIGGNLSRTESQMVFDLTLVGEVENDRPLLLRRNARPGDLVLVTGTLGDSRAGLEIALRAVSYTHLDVYKRQELSRLGRNLLMIMGILNECMNRDIQVWTIKDNYRLGSDISSKVLAFAFGLSAEIERNLISQRTKEALARKKAEGVVLGRPKGRKSAKTKLTGQEKKIKELLDKRVSYSAIGRILGVHRLTVSSFVKGRMN